MALEGVWAGERLINMSDERWLSRNRQDCVNINQNGDLACFYFNVGRQLKVLKVFLDAGFFGE